jgi:hypothetical protein
VLPLSTATCLIYYYTWEPSPSETPGGEGAASDGAGLRRIGCNREVQRRAAGARACPLSEVSEGADCVLLKPVWIRGGTPRKKRAPFSSGSHDGDLLLLVAATLICRGVCEGAARV